MFSNVGWGEVLVVCLVILIFVGPDRLPQVIQDIRAGFIAARDAISKTKQQLNDEIGPEFEQIAKPVQEFSRFTAMGPKAALTKALFDGDGSYLDMFDPKKIMAEDTQGQAYRADKAAHHQSAPESSQPAHKPQAAQPPVTETETSGTAARSRGEDQAAQPHNRNFSWEDVT